MKYQIEVHDHGWLVCAPPGQAGVPMDALKEITPMFRKHSVIHPGIVHHYNATGRSSAMFAIATPENCERWKREIADKLRDQSPQRQWYYGTDTGRSSIALFHVFCDPMFKRCTSYSFGAVPGDAGDFGRCSRLLKLFPEWRARLNEVATAYPDTKWPAIIARWSEIEMAAPAKQTEILRTIRTTSQHQQYENQKSD